MACAVPIGTAGLRCTWSGAIIRVTAIGTTTAGGTIGTATVMPGAIAKRARAIVRERLGTERLEYAHQLGDDADPRRVGDYLLAAARFERQDLKLLFIPVDQAAEEEPAGRARD